MGEVQPIIFIRFKWCLQVHILYCSADWTWPAEALVKALRYISTYWTTILWLGCSSLRYCLTERHILLLVLLCCRISRIRDIHFAEYTWETTKRSTVNSCCTGSGTLCLQYTCMLGTVYRISVMKIRTSLSWWRTNTCHRSLSSSLCCPWSWE